MQPDGNYMQRAPEAAGSRPRVLLGSSMARNVEKAEGLKQADLRLSSVLRSLDYQHATVANIVGLQYAHKALVPRPKGSHTHLSLGLAL